MSEQRGRILFCFLCHSNIRVCGDGSILTRQITSLPYLPCGGRDKVQWERVLGAAPPSGPADMNKKQSRTHELQWHFTVSKNNLLQICQSVTKEHISILAGHVSRINIYIEGTSYNNYEADIGFLDLVQCVYQWYERYDPLRVIILSQWCKLVVCRRIEIILMEHWQRLTLFSISDPRMY